MYEVDLAYKGYKEKIKTGRFLSMNWFRTILDGVAMSAVFMVYISDSCKGREISEEDQIC